MKLSNVLYKQHLGRMFRFNWHKKGNRRIIDYGSIKELSDRGISFVDAIEFTKAKFDKINLDVVGFKPTPIKMDKSHPDWHDRKCLFHEDENVLLEGLDQARHLTKTIDMSADFRWHCNRDNYDKETASGKLRSIIKLSKMFDAYQEKLPKVKDPARPAWNFPRSYGITQERVNSILLTNLIQLCENMSNIETISNRTLTSKAQFSFFMEKSKCLMQFQQRADTFMSSNKMLKPFTDSQTSSTDVPHLKVIEETITLVPKNIYRLEHFYPLSLQYSKCHPHTIFVHYNETEVKNLFEETVTENQIVGRSLMKSFTATASYARIKYGENVKELPEPVCIQCVQTDGRNFYFSKFQLNTLNFENNNGIKNVCYHYPRMELYSECSYRNGEPILHDYNSEVLDCFYSFFQSS